MSKTIPSSLPYPVICVERAVEDLRRGVPVVLVDPAIPNKAQLVVATEAISDDALAFLRQAELSDPYVVVTRTRAKFLFASHLPEVPNTALTLSLTHITDNQAKTLHAVCGETAIDPTIISALASHTLPAAETDMHALALIKIAELLPSAVIATLTTDNAEAWAFLHRLQLVSSTDIVNYSDNVTLSLRRVGEAPLSLRYAEQARIFSYRPSIGGREHYAIIAGTPEQDAAPLVRVHSSCYTGDLLASLKCDCGDQLHEALRFMGEKAAGGDDTTHGGIVIYLLQEGRGIGLTNKLRAYTLQANGLDTVDANEALGFEDDERVFQLAAAIITDMGFSTIRLLTNNPRKAKGLEALGITVAACVPHIMPSHAHNDSYLKTKAARLGHDLKFPR